MLLRLYKSEEKSLKALEGGREEKAEEEEEYDVFSGKAEREREKGGKNPALANSLCHGCCLCLGIWVVVEAV